MISLPKLGIGMVGVCLICTSACRSSSWQTTSSVATLQAERRDKVEKSIDEKRAKAELQVAKEAGAFGDREACLAAVKGVLERDPGNVEALLLKAVVHISKNEFTEADRAIAIALSHEPKNTTAKRLSEIARSKQLAQDVQKTEKAIVDATPAPLPGGAQAEEAYTPSDAGTALVDDQRRKTPEVEAAIDSPFVSGETSFAKAAFEASPGASNEPGFFHAFESLHEELLALGSHDAQAPPAPVQEKGFVEIQATPKTEPHGDVQEQTPPRPVFAEVEPKLPASASTVEELPSQLLAGVAQELPEEEPGFAETIPAEEVAETTPTAFQPQETAELASYDAPAGCVEVSDLDGVDGSSSQQDKLSAALAAADANSALAAVETDLTDNPNDPQIAVMATVAALEANQSETAASIARLGIAYHPACAALHRSLGAALYRMGKYASSQVALQQALSLDNSSALSYFLMGCVSEKLGDAEAAESHFRRATELDPTLASGE